MVYFSGVRACRTHLDGCQFNANAIEQLSNHTEGTVEFGEVFSLLKSGVREICECNVLNFDKQLSDNSCRVLTGLTVEQFDDLLYNLPFRDKDVWSPRNSLGIYLMKMRTGIKLLDWTVSQFKMITGIFLTLFFVVGLSNWELAVLFGVSVSKVGDRIRRTREHLAECRVVKENMGFGHISREEVINDHTTPFAKRFFGGDDKVVVIADGWLLILLFVS